VSRSLRRGALAAVLALSLAPLAACAAGNSAQTMQIQPDTAATTVGDIQIQNAFVLTPPQSQTTGPASVTARVFNNGSSRQTIESITIGSTQARLSDKDGGQTIVVPAHGSVLLGGKGNASATLQNSQESVMNGGLQAVAFDLSDTGKVSVQAHVQPATGYYASYGPSGAPAASTSPAASASPSASASAGASPAKSAAKTAAKTASSTPSASKS